MTYRQRKTAQGDDGAGSSPFDNKSSATVGDALGIDPTMVEDPADLIRAVVAFANAETTPPIETRLPPLFDDEGWFPVGEEGPYLVYVADEPQPRFVDEAEALRIAYVRIEQDRQFAIDAMNSAADGLQSLISWVRKVQSTGKRSGIALIPVLDLSDQHFSLKWKFSGPSSADGWVMFTIALLGSSAVDEQTDVGRCQLESCGRFFVIERGKVGKPQTKYCCDEHRLEQHSALAAERQRRSRARKKELARQPRRRRK